MRPGCRHTDLSAKLVDGVEQVNASTAGADFCRARKNLRSGLLPDANACELDVKAVALVNAATAAGVQGRTAEIKYAIRGGELARRANRHIAGEQQARRRRIAGAPVDDAERTTGGEGAQVVDIGLRQRDRALSGGRANHIAGERICRDHAGARDLGHRATDWQAGGSQNHRAGSRRDHIQGGIGGVLHHDRRGPGVAGGQRTVNNNVVGAAVRINNDGTRSGVDRRATALIDAVTREIDVAIRADVIAVDLQCATAGGAAGHRSYANAAGAADIVRECQAAVGVVNIQRILVTARVVADRDGTELNNFVAGVGQHRRRT